MPFQPGVMFAGKAGAYPRVMLYSGRDKHSSLFRTLLYYGRKKFYTIKPCTKRFCHFKQFAPKFNNTCEYGWSPPE